LAWRTQWDRLELADFIGLDVCLVHFEVIYDGFKNPKYAPNPLLVNMVRAVNLVKKLEKGFITMPLRKKSIVPAARFL